MNITPPATTNQAHICV